MNRKGDSEDNYEYDDKDEKKVNSKLKIIKKI